MAPGIGRGAMCVNCGGEGCGVGTVTVTANEQPGLSVLDIRAGTLATSGDSRRFVLKDSVRYGHILDPWSGWPVEGAPRSITVAADTCTQAGMLTTLAMLEDCNAEAFRDSEGVQYWCQR